MKTSAYVVYDQKAETYSTPSFFKNEELAKRWFAMYVQEGSIMYMAPEDFELVYFGEYDDEELTFVEDVNKPAVLQAIDVVRIKENLKNE